MKTEAMYAAELSDADLVAESLSGNRDAFGWIVERYQTLIASLAYCATGNVSQSEDLAQADFRQRLEAVGRIARTSEVAPLAVQHRPFSHQQ